MSKETESPEFLLPIGYPMDRTLGPEEIAYYAEQGRISRKKGRVSIQKDLLAVEKFAVCWYAIVSLEGMPGYPRTEAGVKMRVRSLARLVHNLPKEFWIGWMPSWERFFRNGANTDLEWIIDLVQDECEMFPSHAEVRAMYAKGLPPANGDEQATEY